MSSYSIVMPFTHLRREVLEALDGWEPRLCYVGDADDAYWRLLHWFWGEGQGFCLVEHDVVVGPDTLSILIDCSSRWCSVSVAYGEKRYAGMACAKFSPELIAAVPDALERVAKLPGDETHPPRHWCRLDSWMQAVLNDAGETMCVHELPIEHLDPHASHVSCR